MKLLIFLFFLSGLSCQDIRKKDGLGIIDISPTKDSCHALIVSGKRIKASRKVTIIENTLSDTILFGFSIIPPNYKGELMYLQQDTGTNNSFHYIDGKEELLPKTNEFCIHLYQKRMVNGKIRVQYFYEE